MIGYKLFREKGGKLFPLYVNANEEIPIGVWLDAECGPMEDGKVKSRLGKLAFRPGWHINDKAPYVEHIYSKRNGKKVMKEGTVWAEVEYHTAVDYTYAAKRSGKSPRDQYLKEIPVGGFYRYKTSPQMFGEWIIAGEMRVNRIMSDDEVYKLCEDQCLEPLRREEA